MEIGKNLWTPQLPVPILFQIRNLSLREVKGLVLLVSDHPRDPTLGAVKTRAHVCRTPLQCSFQERTTFQMFQVSKCSPANSAQLRLLWLQFFNMCKKDWLLFPVLNWQPCVLLLTRCFALVSVAGITLGVVTWGFWAGINCNGIHSYFLSLLSTGNL